MFKNNQIADHTEYFDIFYREHNGIDLKIAITAKKADSKTVIQLSLGEIAWDKLYPAGMNTPAVDREIICRPSELLEKDKLCILVIRGKPGTIKGLDEGIFSSWNNSFENAQKNKLYVICEKEFQTLL